MEDIWLDWWHVWLGVSLPSHHAIRWACYWVDGLYTIVCSVYANSQVKDKLVFDWGHNQDVSESGAPPPLITGGRPRAEYL